MDELALMTEGPDMHTLVYEHSNIYLYYGRLVNYLIDFAKGGEQCDWLGKVSHLRGPVSAKNSKK